jgi:hypothetical protein
MMPIMQVDALVKFCEEIKIVRGDLIAADQYNNFRLRNSVKATNVQRLTLEALQEITSSLGNIFNLKIFIPGDTPILEVRRGKLDNPQNALMELNQREPETVLQVEIIIDKQSISAKFDWTGEDVHTVFFIFHEAFLSFLKESSLLELDQLLFSENSTRTVILVGDASYYYKGKLLSILGLAGTDSVSRLDFTIDNIDTKTRVDSCFKIANENLGWVGFRLKNLTPEHFICLCEQNNDANITLELSNRLFCLCILFTANRTIYNEDKKSFSATYASSDQTSTLLLNRINEISDNTQNALSRFAAWIHEGRSTDRLIILQNVTARQLWLTNPEKNFEKLKSELKFIIADADRNYRIYTDSRIDKHFDATRSLSDYISGIARDVSGTVESVTKGLSESLFATIGFIVVTVIAALIKGETQGIVFGIGMKAYAVYVLLFQLCYRMGSIYISYSLLQKECDRRISGYASRLYLSKVELTEIETPLNIRRIQFIIWFWVTASIYLAIGIALLWFSDPAHLLQIGIEPPLPPTPAVTLTPVQP